jgi:MerR family copper efflux transcriptional regulator
MRRSVSSRPQSGSTTAIALIARRARSLGFALKDIRALLSLYRDRRRVSRDVKRLALRHVAEVDRKIAELTAIRNAIADLAKRCQGNDRPECPILDELEAATH